MKIAEYGNNWLIEDQLDNQLLNDIKNFFDKHLEFLHNDKEGYSTTGDNAEQYWIQKQGEKPFFYKNKEYEEIESCITKYSSLYAIHLMRADDRYNIGMLNINILC